MLRECTAIWPHVFIIMNIRVIRFTKSIAMWQKIEMKNKDTMFGWIVKFIMVNYDVGVVVTNMLTIKSVQWWWT